MARSLRPQPDPDGATTFHALNRGNNLGDVFFDDEDRQAYLDAIAKAKERYPFRLFGYCLMPNHVHLIIRPEAGESISRIMQSITVAHTWRHHRVRGTSGHVWQSRFRSPPVEHGDHFLTLMRFVESNPTRVGMVENPADHPWSSHAARVTKHRNPILDEFPEWADLGGDEKARRAAWRRRVARPLSDAELSKLRESTLSGRPFGGAEWAVETLERLGCPRPEPKRRGRPPKSASESLI